MTTSKIIGASKINNMSSSKVGGNAMGLSRLNNQMGQNRN